MWTASPIGIGGPWPITSAASKVATSAASGPRGRSRLEAISISRGFARRALELLRGRSSQCLALGDAARRSRSSVTGDRLESRPRGWSSSSSSSTRATSSRSSTGRLWTSAPSRPDAPSDAGDARDDQVLAGAGGGDVEQPQPLGLDVLLLLLPGVVVAGGLEVAVAAERCRRRPGSAGSARARAGPAGRWLRLRAPRLASATIGYSRPLAPWMVMIRTTSSVSSATVASISICSSVHRVAQVADERPAALLRRRRRTGGPGRRSRAGSRRPGRRRGGSARTRPAGCARPRGGRSRRARAACASGAGRPARRARR